VASLTRPGWSLLGGGAAALAAGRLLATTELYVLGGVALSLVLVAVITTSRRPPAIAAARSVRPSPVHLGDGCTVELRFTNHGTRTSPILDAHDAVTGTQGARIALAPLGPGNSTIATYRLPTASRGVTTVGPLDSVRTDPFGLVRSRDRITGLNQVTILPRVEALATPGRGNSPEDPLAGVAHPIPGRAGDDEFATLRPYEVGDDLRRVHWASTARLGDLMVRQDEPPWQGQLTVMLDARRSSTDPTGFEVAVSAAATLLVAAAHHGDRARLVITDGTDTGFVDSRAHQTLLLEHLALVDRHPGRRLPDLGTDRRLRRGGLVLITGSHAPENVAALAGLRTRFDSLVLVQVQGPVEPGPDPANETAARPPAATVAPRSVETVLVAPGASFATAWTDRIRLNRRGTP